MPARPLVLFYLRQKEEPRNVIFVRTQYNLQLFETQDALASPWQRKSDEAHATGSGKYVQTCTIKVPNAIAFPTEAGVIDGDVLYEDKSVHYISISNDLNLDGVVVSIGIESSNPAETWKRHSDKIVKFIGVK